MMKCAKSDVPCEDCKKRSTCSIYREYMIEASRPYPLYGRVINPQPLGDKWTGWVVPEVEVKEGPV